jgi:hypothetical protein
VSSSKRSHSPTTFETMNVRFPGSQSRAAEIQ